MKVVVFPRFGGVDAAALLHRPPIQEHDLLICRSLGEASARSASGSGGTVPADGDPGFAAVHAAAEINDLPLRIGHTQVRTDFQRDVLMPVGVLAGVEVAGPGVADA